MISRELGKPIDEEYRYVEEKLRLRPSACDYALYSIYENLLQNFKKVVDGEYVTHLPNLKQVAIKRGDVVQDGYFLVLKDNRFADNLFVGYTFEPGAKLFNLRHDKDIRYCYMFGINEDEKLEDHPNYGLMVGKYIEGKGITMLQRHFNNDALDAGNHEVNLAVSPVKSDFMKGFVNPETVQFMGKCGDKEVEFLLDDYKEKNGRIFSLGQIYALLHAMDINYNKKMIQLMFKFMDNKNEYKINKMYYDLHNANQMGQE